MSIQNLEEDILKIWGRHTEFSAKGNRYVAFVLQHQVDELLEAGFTDEAMDKELADMASVILRHWSRRGQSSEEKIRARLAKRHEGKADQIKDKYLKLYENYLFPQERLRAASELLERMCVKCEYPEYTCICPTKRAKLEAALRGEAKAG